MGKLTIGAILFFIGIFMCFTVVLALPGTGLIVVGGIMMWAGAASLTVSTVKVGVTVGKMVNARSKLNEEEASSEALSNKVSKLQKWEALVQVDSTIAEAALQARVFGSETERILAERYLVLGDEKYLPAILSQVLGEARRKVEDEGGLSAVELLKGDVPSSGEVNRHKFKRNDDGTFLIIRGKFVGRMFQNYAELVAFSEKN